MEGKMLENIYSERILKHSLGTQQVSPKYFHSYYFEWLYSGLFTIYVTYVQIISYFMYNYSTAQIQSISNVFVKLVHQLLCLLPGTIVLAALCKCNLHEN